jgi:hypothetical protein
MATSIPADDLDDRIIASEAKIAAAEALIENIRVRVVALETPSGDPSPPGTMVILPIIGYHIIYTVPEPAP